MGGRIKLGNEDFYFWGFNMLDRWLHVRNSGDRLYRFFEDNDIHGIAVYGAGAIGRRLMEELGVDSKEILFAIDRNANAIKGLPNGIRCLSFEDDWPKVDCIVITPIHFYDIRDSLRKKVGNDVNIVSVDDVVDYCFEKADS